MVVVGGDLSASVIEKAQVGVQRRTVALGIHVQGYCSGLPDRELVEVNVLRAIGTVADLLDADG